MTNETMEQLPKLQAAFSGLEEKYPRTLAQKYFRIARKVDENWGTRETLRYLDSLLMSERSERQGFGDEILEEVSFLKQLHEYLYPILGRDPHDPFAKVSHNLLNMEAVQESGKAAKGKRKVSTPEAAAAAPERTAKRIDTGADRGLLQLWPEISTSEELHLIMDERRAGLVSPRRDTRKLGEILQERGLVTDQVIENALKIQKKSKQPQPIGQILVSLGVVVQEDVTFALCVQSGRLIIDLIQFPIVLESMEKVPVTVAREKEAVPVAVMERTLFLAVNDPLSFPDRQYFAFLTDLNVELCAAARNKLVHRLNAYGQGQSAKEGDAGFRRLAKRALDSLPGGDRNGSYVGQPDKSAGTSRITEDDATVVGLVNKMISDAAACNASDIHIEAYSGAPTTRIRFRRDGDMEEYSEYPAAYHEAVVSRIKIMAALDISERRKPQDGKISFHSPGLGRMDLRVATIPTTRGIETVTIRILAGGEPIPLAEIGMSEVDLARFQVVVEKPYGLILVCGPTGSGKTTTLHSVLREINTPVRKIWTAEDPIEIVQKNICQVQVNPKIDFTFANALRSFLRADPDVIMIGEMRDVETARIAVEASMTGHLVLSTLHTNSATETAARLLDLGVDPFNLSDAILAILAQRLARGICQKCGESVTLAAAAEEELAAEYHFSSNGRAPSFPEREAIVSGWRERFGNGGKLRVKKPVGCRECGGTGYKGRLALFELLVASTGIRALVRSHSAASDFLGLSIAEGMKTLKQDGIEKVLQGLTDMHQVRGAAM